MKITSETIRGVVPAAPEASDTAEIGTGAASLPVGKIAQARPLGWKMQWLAGSLRAFANTCRTAQNLAKPVAMYSSRWRSKKNGSDSYAGDAEPSSTIGPIITAEDAPRLFELLKRISRLMGGMYPSEVRISYLPACGVLDIDDDSPVPHRVLIIGLPALLIWSTDELAAVLAHEMAHLKLQDVAFFRDVVQYSEQLIRSGQSTSGRRRWRVRLDVGQWIGKFLYYLAAPISREMEFTADRWAADCFGGRHLARALEKLAIVQPLFREVLLHFDALATPKDNVYSFFCRAWRRMDKHQYAAMYERLILSRSKVSAGDMYPPICERVQRLRRRPRPPRKSASGAIQLLETPKEIAAVLHKRLYGSHELPNVFYRTR